MKYDYHAIIIGGGSAGLVVASGCSTLGAKVALVEKGKMGGDCLNTGCVPSKTFLKSAHMASYIKEAGKYGVQATVNNVDMGKVMSHVHEVIEEIAPHDSKERFEKMGADVYLEKAEFINNHTVKLSSKTITGKNIVIATGSQPMVPPIPGLKDIPYLTNKNIFDIKELPKHLLVLGGGPIGLELSQGFHHLGSEVTVIDMLPHLFPKDDPEVALVMEKKLKEDGINFSLLSKIVEVKKDGDSIIVVVERNGVKTEYKGDQILVALGRVPDIKNIGLDKVGVKLNKRGYIEVDDTLKTSISNIYACGDAVGPFQFTHMASYQAGIVVRNLIFPYKSKVDYHTVPWTTYTKPEVAHVGYTESWAKADKVFYDSIIMDLDEMDRAKTESEKIGFLKLILNKKGIIIGATIVSEKAGEMIPLATLAIKKKMKATEFGGLIFSYPTESEIYKYAAYKVTRNSFKPWMKSIIKKLFV